MVGAKPGLVDRQGTLVQEAANPTAVITTARQQGTADQEAEDLLDQAADLANAVQPGHKDDNGHNKDEGEGASKDQEAALKLAEPSAG